MEDHYFRCRYPEAGPFQQSEPTKNASSKRSSATSTASRKSVARQRIAGSLSTRISKIFSPASAKAYQALLTSTKGGSVRLGNMKSTQKSRLSSTKTGSQLQRTTPAATSSPFSISSLSGENKMPNLQDYQKELRELSSQHRKEKQENFSSLTGKVAGYIQNTTIKSPFTVSQLSPNSLLCSACGRSTFTLTSDKSGRKPFIVTRCTNCGQRGMLVPESFSKLLKIRKE